MKFIKFTKEILDAQHLSILREIGRHLGVKAPAGVKNKEQLIDKILKIQAGEEMPAAQSKRGAKVKLNPIIPKELIDFEDNFDYSDAKPIDKAILTDNVIEVTGILEILKDGYGFLRAKNFENSSQDAHVSSVVIKKYNLRRGDLVKGLAVPKQDTAPDLCKVEEINGINLIDLKPRRNFDELKPYYPTKRICLETKQNDLSLRSIDLFSPLGFGQRGLIVAPPKTGKTTLLKKVAKAIETNHPTATLIVLLIDERPEEVTDIEREILSKVVYSTFDQTPEHHVKVAELVINHAKRLVEGGGDVVILLDSITRLARAYNSITEPSGKTLSGGIDPTALQGPKKFFGSARSIDKGGSLTILATALVDTESRMDEVIFEEFKGTGNMEIHLSTDLAERRIFPAIDLYKSGTRKEELLLTEQELVCASKLRRFLSSRADSTDLLLDMMKKTESNQEFTVKADVWLNLMNK